MTDPLRPGGEYTDSELPLSAELPKEEYEEVEEVLGTDDLDGDLDDLDDTDEIDVEIIEVDDDTP
jgi:hypothetical protein